MKLLALRLLAPLSLLMSLTTAAPAQYTRAPHRTISGKVTDRGGEPLRGAVVQIEAEDTLVIQSYETDQRGVYHFRNLSSETNYQVWVRFRGRESKHHEMSKFDHTNDRVVDLVIDLTKD